MTRHEIIKLFDEDDELNKLRKQKRKHLTDSFADNEARDKIVGKIIKRKNQLLRAEHVKGKAAILQDELKRLEQANKDYIRHQRMEDDAIDEYFDRISKKLPKRLVSCECGSEKTHGEGAPHSSWCPKYRV